MSVDRVTYVIYGVKIKYDTKFSNMFYEYYAPKADSPEIILDGMNADYMVFGKILAAFYDYKGGPFQEIDIDSLKQIEIEYKQKFESHFPDYNHYMENKFKLLAFDHYS